MAIGFNRIAKEDTFLLFFFLLANVFWLRGQRVAESQPERNPEKYYWATAAAFGAMMASKYLPQLLTISMGYYWLFQRIPETRWRLGKKRMLIFFAVMGATFIVLNPDNPVSGDLASDGLVRRSKTDGPRCLRVYGQTLQPPDDGLAERNTLVFLPRLRGGQTALVDRSRFRDRVTTAFPTQARRRALLHPVVAVSVDDDLQFCRRKVYALFHGRAAGGADYLCDRCAVCELLDRATSFASRSALAGPMIYVQRALALLVVLGASESGRGCHATLPALHQCARRRISKSRDTSSRTMSFTMPACVRRFSRSPNAQDPGRRSRARLQPWLLTMHNVRIVRIWFASCFPIRNALKQLSEGDFVIDARGRRYFSNELVLAKLKETSTPAFRVSLGAVPSASVYQLDKKSRDAVVEVAQPFAPLARHVRPVEVQPATAP